MVDPQALRPGHEVPAMEQSRTAAGASQRNTGENNPRSSSRPRPNVQRRQETTRLLNLLESCPGGLTKAEILESFYDDFTRSSPLRRSSLEVRLNKLLQRSRRRVRPHGGDIAFDRHTRLWRIVAALRSP